MMSALPLLAAMCRPVAPLAVRLAWSEPATKGRQQARRIEGRQQNAGVTLS